LLPSFSITTTFIKPPADALQRLFLAPGALAAKVSDYLLI
jgi:hypothetical protein